MTTPARYPHRPPRVWQPIHKQAPLRNDRARLIPRWVSTQAAARLGEAGFTAEQQHGRALRLTYELERPRAPAYRLLFRWLPEGVYAALRRAFPTLIFTLRPVATSPADATSQTRDPASTTLAR